ncbi:MAG: SulP family inorganic anion transporter [bacterium]
MLKPKILDTLKNYSLQLFLNDLMAGFIVGIVALPLAIAFAIASGVTPDKGIYTAIIAGFIISALGGSRIQIGGPTGAFVAILYGIVLQHGIPGLLVATMLAGFMLIIMGLAKFGSVIKFIPHSVIVGFTAGLALLIMSSQISELLGLNLHKLPVDFVEKMHMIYHNLDKTNIYALFICTSTMLSIFIMSKLSRYIPGSLIAIIITAALVKIFNIPVETIGSRFGEIPHHFPSFAWPTINFKTVQQLLNPAFTIALLGAIETLLSDVVADSMIGGKHRPNMELIALGIANIASPLFGGLPATGAMAKTTTNFKSGGRTPIAGIFHAFVILVIMLFFGKLAGLIPLSCLAGILIIVAYNMSEWRGAIAIIKTSVSSAFVLIITFVLTIVVDLTVALEIGLILATLIFVRNMSLYTNISILMPTTGSNNNTNIDTNTDTNSDDSIDSEIDLTLTVKKNIPAETIVYEINGPLFFGAAYKFKEALATIANTPKVIILRMRHVPMIDSTGLHLLEESIHQLSKKGVVFIISGAQPQVSHLLKNSGIVKKIGIENICETFDKALKRATDLCKK